MAGRDAADAMLYQGRAAFADPSAVDPSAEGIAAMTAVTKLDGPRHPPASGGPAHALVILLHGLGADGNDLIGLAPVLSEILPDAAFVARTISLRHGAHGPAVVQLSQHGGGRYSHRGAESGAQPRCLHRQRIEALWPCRRPAGPGRLFARHHDGPARCVAPAHAVRRRGRLFRGVASRRRFWPPRSRAGRRCF